jgi:hypothetical protein
MKLLLSIVAATAVWTASGQGTFEAVANYANTSPAFFDGTAGGTFEVKNYETVTALGAFDYLFGQNQGNIQVGLWDSSGNLLASSIIAPTNSLVNQTRYQSITPVFLDPNHLYHLGAYSPNGTIYLDIAAPALGGVVSTASQIALGDSAATAGGFTSPADVAGTPGALYLGANFEFQDRVPEPSAGLLIGMAGCLFAAGRRWRPRAPNAS